MTVLRDAYTHEMKQGDTDPSVRRRLISATDKQPIDLTDVTGKFFLMDVDGNLIVDGTVTFESPRTDGVFRYDWEAGDTDDAGDYTAEFQLTFLSGAVLTVPNDGYISVPIAEQLGS